MKKGHLKNKTEKERREKNETEKKQKEINKEIDTNGKVVFNICNFTQYGTFNQKSNAC